MKRKIFTLILATALSAVLTACSDSAVGPDVLADISTEGTLVSKAELLDALWQDSDEAAPAAECLASSSFIIYSTNGFSIARNPQKTTENPSDALIVTSVNIAFTEEGNDGRGASCGTGDLRFIVSATAETPIPIVSAQEILARHSVGNLAKDAATPYPACTITAHFEQAGVELCEDNADDVTEVEDQAADQAEDEQGVAADEDSDTPADDESAEEEQDDGDDEGSIVIVTPVFKPSGTMSSGRFKALVVDEPVKCGETEVRSLRMVVDDFNCRLQETTPARLGGNPEDEGEQG